MQSADRLSALDATFLYAESPGMPMHLGMLGVLDRVDADSGELLAYLERRSAREPRTRKRLATVPGELGRPVLVDDERFDIRRHVRRVPTPRPYDDGRAVEFVAELMRQPLPRDRPLWRAWTFDMTEGRTGLIMCVHHCLTDGIAGLKFAMAFLSPTPGHAADDEPPAPGVRGGGPGAIGLVAGAAAGFVADQAELARTAARAVLPRGGVVRALAAAPGLAAGLLGRISGPSTEPLFERVGAERALATLELDLGDVKLIKDRHGCKVNDVMLAATTAGLRAALGVTATSSPELTVTASMPVDLRSTDNGARNSVAQLVVELPVGEPDPVLRLQTVAGRTRALKRSGAADAAARIMRIADAAPPAVLRFASRLAAARGPADLLVTNVAGPPAPLYLMQAKLRAMYPFAPLAGTTAVSVAVVSHVGRMFLGVNADPEAIESLDVLIAGIRDDVEALVEAAR